VSDTIPTPTIPDYIMSVFSDNDDTPRHTRWPLALAAALKNNAEPALIQWIVMYFEGKQNDLASSFAWIEILEAAGWQREQLAELMKARFKAEDPNVTDFGSQMRVEFLRHPLAWRLATDNNLIGFVEAEVREHPTEVLEQNAALAERLGQREADRLAVLACRFVHSLSVAAVETIMRLGREIVMSVAHQVVVHRGFSGGVPLRRVHELRLLTYAAMETRFDERSDRAGYIWIGVRDALSPDKRKPDPDQPFRVFRWMLKFAAEAPFEVETWMRRQNLDEVKQRRYEYFVEHLRKTMVDFHYGFATVDQTERDGQRQFEVVIKDRGGELKFVEAYKPSSRDDAIQDGTEVIVTLRPDGKPAFVYRGGRGFITNMHPVAVPTPAMEATVATRHGVV